MAFNGSGTFSRLFSWATDAANGIKIRSDRMDSEMDGFAAGLSNCIVKDGQTTITADLPMASFRHTGVGDASARTHYAVVGQIQDGDYTVLGSVAGTDTITASASPAITAYAAGQVFRFVAVGTNTGATTLNLNSVGAKTIQKLGSALVAGDITTGDGVLVQYDGTQFQMLSPARTPVLTAGGIATAALADNAVTLAKLEDGTEGDTLYYGASGAPTRLAKGTAGQVYRQNSGETAPEWGSGSTLTAAVSASSTSVPIGSIPSWVREITIQISGLSTNGTASILLQLGDSGGVENTGYLGSGSSISTTVTSATVTGGFVIVQAPAANGSYNGNVTLRLANASTNLWAMNSTLGTDAGTAATHIGAGSKALSATLDRLLIAAVNGTDTFDAGAISVQYR